MDKTMTIVVPRPAGTGGDVLARIIADGLMKKWGNKIVIENRGEDGGNVGQDLVAKSAPDGYTWIHTSPAPGANNHLTSKKKLPYTMADFSAVALTNETDMVVVVRADSPAKSMKELIALAQSKPGALKYAHPGNGTYSHMTGLALQDLANVSFEMVPSRGAALQMQANLASGQIDVIVDQAPTYITLIKEGKVRPLATAGDKRSALLPDVPTLKESGINFTAAPWYGMQGPKNVPPAILESFSKGIAEVLKDPAYKERLDKGGLTPRVTTPAEFAALLDDEIKKWKPVVEKYKIQTD
jgi:tripartite-type tricarboxylate transporter receptor subunit TctC